MFVKNVHGIRYQVKDVARAIAFYTNHLGFKLERQRLPAFANISLGDAQIILSGPGASGSRPMPNGQTQEPGGWNRVVLKVADLPACITALKKAGIHFRNEMETGTLVADKSRLKTPRAIRSNCSSQLTSAEKRNFSRGSKKCGRGVPPRNESDGFICCHKIS